MVYTYIYMKILNEKVRIIKCEHKSGTSKTGKPYSLYTMEVVDEQYNKFQVTVPSSSLIEGVVPGWLLEAENLEVVMDLEIVPKGFDVAMRATAICEN